MKSPSRRRIQRTALALAFALAGMSAHAAPPRAKPGKATKATPPADSPPAEAAPAAAAPTAAAPTATAPATAQPKASAPTTADPFAGDAAASGQGGSLLGDGATSSARTSDLHGDRLDGVEAETNALKDRIFRSKARLAVLRDTVMSGVAAGSRVVLAHRNLMGAGFRLVRIAYILDGAQIFARSDDSGALDAEDELLVFDGNLPPGPHELRVELTYQGQGWGVFSYLRGYTFKSASNHSFVAGEGGQFKLVSKGYERGNLTTEMKDRPAVDWQSVALDGSAGAPAKQ